jgi:transposase
LNLKQQRREFKMANEKTELTQGNTGNRYTEDQKIAAVKYLEKEDTERGNITRAMAKFGGVSYIALRSWIAKYGSDSKPAKTPKKVGRPPAKKEVNEEKGTGKRGRKANPSIFALRLLEKMQKTNSRDAKALEKAIAKIKG